MGLFVVNKSLLSSMEDKWKNPTSPQYNDPQALKALSSCSFTKFTSFVNVRGD